MISILLLKLLTLPSEFEQKNISHYVSNVTTNVASGVLQKIKTNNSTISHHSRVKLNKNSKWTPCPYNWLNSGEFFLLKSSPKKLRIKFNISAPWPIFSITIPWEADKFSCDMKLYKIIRIWQLISVYKCPFQNSYLL